MILPMQRGGGGTKKQLPRGGPPPPAPILPAPMIARLLAKLMKLPLPGDSEKL